MSFYEASFPLRIFFLLEFLCQIYCNLIKIRLFNFLQNCRLFVYELTNSPRICNKPFLLAHDKWNAFGHKPASHETATPDRNSQT